MANKSLENIEKRIVNLKKQLVNLGNMRPGTLSVQYRKPTEKEVPFSQISYTRKGKSRSEYVRPENVSPIKKEIKAYKRFKSIIDEMIDLSIQASRLRCSNRSDHK